jgi:hypothetical protein
MTINDIYINKEAEMNRTIMDWVSDNKIIIKIYIATMYIVESLATFIGFLTLYAGLRFMVNSLFGIIVQLNHTHIFQIMLIVSTAIVVAGIIVGSYTIMTRIADRFEELKAENNDLIRQLNMAIDMNAKLLITRISKYEDTDTFGDTFGKSIAKMDSVDSVDL